MSFGVYSLDPPARLAPAWFEGREVAAVYESAKAMRPDYVTWIEWRGEKIAFIHDYKFVRYVMFGAELVLV